MDQEDELVEQILDAGEQQEEDEEDEEMVLFASVLAEQRSLLVRFATTTMKLLEMETLFRTRGLVTPDIPEENRRFGFDYNNNSENTFLSFYRMRRAEFNELSQLIMPYLRQRREASVKYGWAELLGATIRFLATGND